MSTAAGSGLWSHGPRSAGSLGHSSLLHGLTSTAVSAAAAASGGAHGCGSHAAPAHVASSITIGSASGGSASGVAGTVVSYTGDGPSVTEGLADRSAAGFQSSVPSQNPPGATCVPSGVGGCQPSVSQVVESAAGVVLATRGGSPRSHVEDPWRMATSMGGASAALLAAPAARAAGHRAVDELHGTFGRPDRGHERGRERSGERVLRREQVGNRRRRVTQRHRLGETGELGEHVDVAVQVVDGRVEGLLEVGGRCDRELLDRLRRRHGCDRSDGSRRCDDTGWGRHRRDGRRPRRAGGDGHRGDRRRSTAVLRWAVLRWAVLRRAVRRACPQSSAAGAAASARGRPLVFGGTRIIARRRSASSGDTCSTSWSFCSIDRGVEPSAVAISSSSRSLTGIRLPAGGPGACAACGGTA